MQEMVIFAAKTLWVFTEVFISKPPNEQQHLFGALLFLRNGFEGEVSDQSEENIHTHTHTCAILPLD